MASHARGLARAPAPQASRAPLSVRLFSPILKALVSSGLPLGYNAIVTIPGRTSGKPRSVALAVVPIGGRRWIWAPWGDVHWVLNIRAARRATITLRRRTEDVSATELDEGQRVEFFRSVLGPFARGVPFGVTFIRLVDGVDLNDPEEAAKRTRVFELHSVD